MAKDPRMSALDKVEGMVKGIGRAVGGGGMAGGMKPKPNPYGKAKRLAGNATRDGKRAVSSMSGRTTGLKPKSPPGVVQDTMRNAGRSINQAGSKAGSKKMSR